MCIVYCHYTYIIVILSSCTLVLYYTIIRSYNSYTILVHIIHLY